MNSPVRVSTRDALINAAIMLLARNPGATTSEIALTAGVGRATLHRHFRTRDDLIIAIQTQCIEETDAAGLSVDDKSLPAQQRLSNMLEAVIPLGDRYHFLSHEMASNAEVTEQYKKELEWTKELVEHLKRDGVFAKSIPTSWAVAQIDQMIWTAWNEVADGRLAISDAHHLALNTLINGLGKEDS